MHLFVTSKKCKVVSLYLAHPVSVTIRYDRRV